MSNQLLLVLLAAAAAGCGCEEARLTATDAQLLLKNVPEVLRCKQAAGCPELDCESLGKDAIFCQVRNMCPKSGSGLIGNYRVDLRTGRIWIGIDPVPDKLIDSNSLRRLRRQLLSKRKR